MTTAPQALRVLIHAPTANAVTRARNNAANLRQIAPHAEVRIIVNADGVAPLLDIPRPDTDEFTFVCENTLNRLGRVAPRPLQTVPASIFAIATMQQDGWFYVRA